MRHLLFILISIALLAIASGCKGPATPRQYISNDARNFVFAKGSWWDYKIGNEIIRVQVSSVDHGFKKVEQCLSCKKYVEREYFRMNLVGLSEEENDGCGIYVDQKLIAYPCFDLEVRPGLPVGGIHNGFQVTAKDSVIKIYGKSIPSVTIMKKMNGKGKLMYSEKVGLINYEDAEHPENNFELIDFNLNPFLAK